MKREIICGIYKITSPTKKIYIGQSLDILQRFSFYKRCDCRKQVKLYHSFKRHGVSKHALEIIHVCEPHELNALEKYYVDLYKTFASEYGLNLRDGGGANGKMSEETKRKLSQGRTGDKHHMYGKSLTKEWRDRIGKSGKGRVTSEEAKRKISSANKGRKPAAATIRSLKEYHSGRKNELCVNSVPIVQCDLNGAPIQEWPCATEASRRLGINQSNISAVCLGNRNKAGGFVWRYKNHLTQTYR